MDPLTMMAISTAANTIGNAVGGGGKEQKPQAQYLVAPEYGQGMLDYWTQMMRGGGDFLAPELRTGQATLGSMLAGRGIAPDSPLAGQLTADMTRRAIDTANQNRFGQMIQMYGTAPATTQQKGFGSWLDNEGSPNNGTWTATGWQPKAATQPVVQQQPRTIGQNPWMNRGNGGNRRGGF